MRDHASAVFLATVLVTGSMQIQAMPATAAPSLGCVETFGGRVSSVSTKSLTVVDATTSRALNFRVLPDSGVIKSNGSQGTLRNVTVGKTVTVTYENCSYLRFATTTIVVRPFAVGGGSRPNGNRGNGGRSNGSTSGAILDSVYDYIAEAGTRAVTAHPERAGYGRYTYVLLMSKADQAKNMALLSAVISGNLIASASRVAIANLNVFEIPEAAQAFSRGTDHTNAQAAVRNYDFPEAHRLLALACASATPPKICDGPETGPFMLTFGYPIGTSRRLNPPYLVVDLHAMNNRGFDEVVTLMKQQVRAQNYPSGEIINNWSVTLFSITLDVSDWLPGLIQRTRDVFQVVP